MAGLTSSFNFNEEERNTKMNNMWRTGQVPMEVNVMPGSCLTNLTMKMSKPCYLRIAVSSAGS